MDPMLNWPTRDESHPQNLPQPQEHSESNRNPGSSFNFATSDTLSGMNSHGFSVAPGAGSFHSDTPLQSHRTPIMSSTQLSPVASPGLTPQSEVALAQSLSMNRASHSPRHNKRPAPHSTSPLPNSKRRLTESYGPQSKRIASTPGWAMNPSGHYSTAYPSVPTPALESNALSFDVGHFLASSLQPMSASIPATSQQQHSMLLPSQIPSQMMSRAYMQPSFNKLDNLNTPTPGFPHNVFRTLQSNAEPHVSNGRYTSFSEPPDLFAPLAEKPSDPPAEDMNPTDPDLIPREQDVRFEGDLYTPKWVRGHGNKREGWCGICKPGRWLVLKNSAYWYDKSFSHGVSAATGASFSAPEATRRMDGNPDVWEGLCESCNDWIPLVSSKKKGTTWFRHAYKVRHLHK